MMDQQLLKTLSTREMYEGEPDADIGSESGGRIIECPNCSYPVAAGARDTTVKCPSCGNFINAAQPAPAADASQKVADIKSLAAAKAYIDYTFETFDWDAFNKDASNFSIPEIDALLNNMKTSNGDNADTWKLCFMYESRCIESKLGSIDGIQSEIIEKYMRGDDTESCHNEYDALCESIQILKSKRAELVESLTRNAAYAGKFGMEESACEELKAKAKALGERIDAVCLVSSLEEHPAVAEKISEKNAATEKAYADAGIDAPAEYDAALSACERGDFDTAVKGLARIPDYRDASKYLEQMNSVFLLNNKYFYMNGKVFFYENGLCFEKDRLVDYNMPETIPFNVYMQCYGTKFFYKMSLDDPSIYYKKLDLRETKKKKTAVHCSTAYGAIRHIGTLEKHPETLIYLAKYDPVAQAAAKTAFCKANNFSSELKINKKLFYGNNWNDILAFDMSTCRFKVLVEGVSAITDIVGDVIYYIAPNLELKKNGMIADIKGEGLYSYDIATAEKRKLITGNSTIEEFRDDHSIIFTRTDHGENNLTIYTKQNEEGAPEKAIVKNVYKFYKVIGDKIFYLVGNEKIKSLCSIRPDGTDRREVMKYMMDIIFTLGDWIYVTRGDASSKFRTLYRIALDGGEPQKVAFGIRSSDLDDPLIKNGYLYYTDHNAELCRVRLNGTGRQSLVQGVWKIVLIKYGKVFYLSYDGKDGGHNIFSLYDMELDGSNRTKLIYNIESLKNIDDRHLIYVREDEFDSKRELYADVKDAKLNARIAKIYKKFDKKKKYPCSSFKVISLYDCETGENERLAYDCAYPEKKALKLEMKEVLRR